MIKGGVPSEFLDELRAKCDIVDVASKYMSLSRRGTNYWACCPFHSEKTPSFSIKQDGQFYKCFGCGESGNVITLVMKMENVDFMTAVEMLSKQVGLVLPNEVDSEEMRKKKKLRERIYAVLKATTEFYHKNLLDYPYSSQAKYLLTRGINKDMIEKFQIGASLDYISLPKHLSNLGFYPSEMIAAGVVGQDEKKRLYDFYGNRLLFPIFNGFGDVVAYSGRSVDANPEHAKYKNTPQTDVFNKSEIMFAYNFVRDLKKSNSLDTIIIVEGHIDVIACHQAGITNTIGCMGTALTTLHAKKIKQLVDNVILCLDGDSAGANATFRAIDTLKDAGLNVRVVRLRGAKDPDEFLKKYGKDNFMEELSKAQNCVDFVLQDSALKFNLDDNADRTKYTDLALNYISKFSTTTEQEIYLEEVQKLVKIPIDILRKSLKQDVKIDSRKPDDTIIKNSSKDNYILESKLMLLASLLHKKITNFSEIQGLFTSNDELSDLYRFLVDKIKENKDYNVSTLFDNFDIKNNSLIDQVINYNFPEGDVFDNYLKDTIKRVTIYELEKKREDVKAKMMTATLDREKLACLEELQEITDKINKEKNGTNR